MGTTWERKGLIYRFTFQWYRGSRTGICYKQLNFISYHLIRLIHGQDKLNEMAWKVSL